MDDAHIIGPALEIELGNGWVVAGAMMSDGSTTWRFQKDDHVTPIRLSAKAFQAMLQIRDELLWRPATPDSGSAVEGE